MSTAAVVFIRPDQFMPSAAICFQYCLMLGYSAAHIVRGDWEAALALTRSGAAEVIVVAGEEDLPSDRSPRVEIVSQLMPGLARHIIQAMPEPAAAPESQPVPAPRPRDVSRTGAPTTPTPAPLSRRSARTRIIRRGAAE